MHVGNNHQKAKINTYFMRSRLPRSIQGIIFHHQSIIISIRTPVVALEHFLLVQAVGIPKVMCLYLQVLLQERDSGAGWRQETCVQVWKEFQWVEDRGDWQQSEQIEITKPTSAEV